MSTAEDGAIEQLQKKAGLNFEYNHPDEKTI